MTIINILNVEISKDFLLGFKSKQIISENLKISVHDIMTFDIKKSKFYSYLLWFLSDAIQYLLKIGEKVGLKLLLNKFSFLLFAVIK